MECTHANFLLDLLAKGSFSPFSQPPCKVRKTWGADKMFWATQSLPKRLKLTIHFWVISNSFNHEKILRTIYGTSPICLKNFSGALLKYMSLISLVLWQGWKRIINNSLSSLFKRRIILEAHKIHPIAMSFKQFLTKMGENSCYIMAGRHQLEKEIVFNHIRPNSS